MGLISVQTSNDRLRELLNSHPHVSSVSVPEPTRANLVFHQGLWRREIFAGDLDSTIKGLMELMDNNPVVCADRVSVPSPASTLALIALGPLIAAGILTETPTLVFNLEANPIDVDNFLATEGWNEGAAIHTESLDLDGVGVVTAMAAIRTPDDLDEVDDLYEERFGRSFFVRRDEDSEWDPVLVRNKPYAVFRLEISEDNPVSLLKIRVMGDIQGKLGEAQIIHAMNVMAGFEESLGIA
jgi:N-acetyl-gamma-glutamylphosphate reductase